MRLGRGLLGDVDALLIEKPRSKVAVLADPASGPVADLVRECYPQARVTVVSVEADESTRHAGLAADGPYDLIIDVVRHRTDPGALYGAVLFHLRRGGHLVIAGFRPETPARQHLWSLVTRLVALRDPASPLTADNADEEALAEATGRVVVGKRHLMVKNVTSSRAKLREAEIGLVLQSAGERVGSVLGGVDAECFAPRSTVRDHADETRVRRQAPVEVPALSLREYHNVICSPGQVVVKGNLLLPETYRHHLQPRLVNRETKEIAPRFAQVDRELKGAERLPGSYFHFDSEWPGHFGHALTEQMSRLWGWAAAKERHPDLKVLVGRRPRHDRALPFERAMLESFGIPEADIVLIDRPVRVERLLAATPMFSMPHYVSPRIAPIWDTVGRAVGPQAENDGTLPRRFFCGRERATRRCHNEADVERRFVATGFEVVFPEHLPFATQVAMFQNAEVVAGYAGSALFTLMFCAQPKRVLMISPESYTANNEYLIAAVLGHEFDVFWSAADSGSLLSSFSFDFDREGRHLDRVLAELDSTAGSGRMATSAAR
ncbi:MAG TPA: glycosyltransferase 61 family protein [Propionibacteriaceae bacterium]|nr:glycosyltransferase 61 family protein [Propionibacteriaceae bacterium]